MEGEKRIKMKKECSSIELYLANNVLWQVLDLEYFKASRATVKKYLKG